MNMLLKKEMRLSALLLTYLFIGFAFMTMIPGYPILCGVFFITLGIFQSFQSAREANDIVFSALLPVAKKDVVKGKYQFCVFIELCGVLVMAVLTLVRMTVLSEASIYRQNALMNANLFFLGMVLLLFGVFNVIFLGGYFKTAYGLGKPFVIYIIVCFFIIGIAEALHHFPGLEALNAFGFDHPVLQLSTLLTGVLLYVLLTMLSYNRSCRNFEKIDL
ncbi:MAG: ABC-2 transporter permease [Clostridiales bacterium]|nr:ABC-2 transporter permease [Clostridiales bacterium]